MKENIGFGKAVKEIFTVKIAQSVIILQQRYLNVNLTFPMFTDKFVFCVIP